MNRGLPLPALAFAAAAAASPSAPFLSGGWALRWTSDAARGLASFEGVEEDRSDSHPGADHILMDGENFRFNMHMVDRDGSDRQRHEVKGVNAPGRGDLELLQGETWMFVYEMFIPGTLTGGSHFSHIFQQKMVSDAGSSGGPVLTLSTAEGNTLLPRVISGFSALPLSGLWDKWIEITFEHKVDVSGNGGYVRWSVRDVAGGTVLTDQKKNGSVWVNEGTRDRRLRPKWGIYRSIESDGLKDCHLLLRNMRAYQDDPSIAIRAVHFRAPRIEGAARFDLKGARLGPAPEPDRPGRVALPPGIFHWSP